MPKFDPKTLYTVTVENINVKDFVDYHEEYVVRPPYQRKSVWSRRKQQDLLDSLFRRYYVPHIVIREVRLAADKTVNEVIDGQQRITTVQNFLNNELALPKSLADVHADLPGRYYADLNSDIRRFVNRLTFKADVVRGIEEPNNPEHQTIATEIFWRLQQGESLNYMEIAHSRLSSLGRNFLVKYADDQRFDYAAYKPIESNADKHKFFNLLDQGNNRMQHLALLARLTLLEQANGATDIKDKAVTEFVDQSKQETGIGNFDFETKPESKRVLSYLGLMHSIFEQDSMVAHGEGLKEFRREYFIISIYMLMRHLKLHYVFDDAEKALFRNFTYRFHERWKGGRGTTDTDMLVFADHRQHSASDIETRHQIIRQVFFEYAKEQGHELLEKDTRRAFSEAERIAIYRRDNGLCQACLAEGKTDKEAEVSWSQYDADHITPHSKGGVTTIENGQVLCQYHNRSKGGAN